MALWWWPLCSWDKGMVILTFDYRFLDRGVVILASKFDVISPTMNW